MEGSATMIAYEQATCKSKLTGKKFHDENEWKSMCVRQSNLNLIMSTNAYTLILWLNAKRTN